MTEGGKENGKRDNGKKMSRFFIVWYESNKKEKEKGKWVLSPLVWLDGKVEKEKIEKILI